MITVYIRQQEQRQRQFRQLVEIGIIIQKLVIFQHFLDYNPKTFLKKGMLFYFSWSQREATLLRMAWMLLACKPVSENLNFLVLAK